MLTAPELSSATPIASIEKISARSRPSMNENASSASMQRLSRTTATASTASIRIGATPSAAKPTMDKSASTATGACPRRNARDDGCETSTSSMSAASR